jgi:GNAT superfamily N-acetyltransferase
MQRPAQIAQLKIRLAGAADRAAIWEIFRSVIRQADTYAFSPDLDEREGMKSWFMPGAEVFVAESSGKIVGTFFVKPNQPGLGSHVANAGFMVDPEARGCGIGRAMGEHALTWAAKRGYKAMQFNFVVSTNQGAVALWQKLGFRIIGTIPGGFRQAELGYVDVYIMHRELG